MPSGSETSATLLLLAYIAWFAGAFIGVLGRGKVEDKFYAALLSAGSILVILAAILGRASIELWNVAAPVQLAFTPLAARTNPLSATFLLLTGVITLAVSVYIPGYLKRTKRGIHKGMLWTFVNLFVIAMCQVITSANAITFLLFWELMSISGAALLLVEHQRRAARKAGLIYFGASAISAAFLIGGFLWLYSVFGSWYFDDWHFDTQTIMAVPVAMIVIGLAIKAGLWPFHVWMPHVYHEALPPLAALFSGVKIQVALYFMIRILIGSPGIGESFAYVLLAVGTVSALGGILFALLQNDLKVLLAYSSVENVGLAVVGIGLTILARKHGLQEVASIALLGTIFHCLNHGICKSLLFLNTGAIETSAGSTNLGFLGGLSHRMPWTLITFFVGTLAIASVPPLNGFASKWLYYQCLLQLSFQSSSIQDNIFAFAIIGSLSLVGAMSIACFAKALGISFLGRPRSKGVAEALEVSRGMVSAQFVLAVGCVLIGLLAPEVLNCCGSILAMYSLPAVHGLYPFAQGKIALVGLLLLGLAYGALTKNGSSKLRRYDTWDCGYGVLPARAEESASSFSEPIAVLFRPLLLLKVTNRISGKDRRHFPESIEVEASVVLILEKYLYRPFLAAANYFNRFLVKVQTSSIHIHLLYVFVTALILMCLGAER